MSTLALQSVGFTDPGAWKLTGCEGVNCANLKFQLVPGGREPFFHRVVYARLDLRAATIVAVTLSF